VVDFSDSYLNGTFDVDLAAPSLEPFVSESDPKFETLLQYLKQSRGFDFTGYKRSSLIRRTGRRMSQVGVNDYGEYLDYLEVNPDEFTALFNTILINVTGFFRDPDVWQYLRTDAIPKLLAEKDPEAPIRVWCAGCASGEEAYTLAIVLAELLGIEEFQRRVKIYATDIDEVALGVARHGSYGANDVDGLEPDLLRDYFEAYGGRYTFRKDLRRCVIFGRNDLVQNAPISRIDMLVCRNTLMYFNAETQARVLTRLHFALAPHGLLFLGKAEMLFSYANLFVPVDLKRRVFRRAIVGDPVRDTQFEPMLPPVPKEAPRGLDRLRNEAFVASPVAQIVVTADGLVALTNRQAEYLFGVSSKDVGRPFRDLDLSYRPVELRRHIERVHLERRAARIAEVEFARTPGEILVLDIQITPLVDTDGSLLGVTLIFTDVTAFRRLHEELEHANRQLEAASEELQSTNEELETTNEELHSTVEELETTNEELQSTNEELETTNEELQSTNDELRNINDELRLRTDELNQANAFLEAILSSLRAGVAVVDRDLRVQMWNRRAEDLWGIRTDQAVGQHLLNLDIGLPTEQLRPLIRQVLTGEAQQQLQLDAVNRRGRAVEVRVTGTPLQDRHSASSAAILVMEPVVDADTG
jgi:two-component system CheB/CheR fusion protein